MQMSLRWMVRIYTLYNIQYIVIVYKFITNQSKKTIDKYCMPKLHENTLSFYLPKHNIMYKDIQLQSVKLYVLDLLRLIFRTI